MESFVDSDKYGRHTADCKRNRVWRVIGLDAYQPTGHHETSVSELVTSPLVFFFRW